MLMIAWTTVATRSDAERLASGAVTAGLAACLPIGKWSASDHLPMGRQNRTLR